MFKISEIPFCQDIFEFDYEFTRKKKQEILWNGGVSEYCVSLQKPGCVHVELPHGSNNSSLHSPSSGLVSKIQIAIGLLCRANG